MSHQDAFTHWTICLFHYSVAAVESSSGATTGAPELLAREQDTLEMAQTMVDGLLQGGYAPNQVAIPLARGAVFAIAEMINRYDLEVL